MKRVTYAARILDYLWAIAPDGATNGQIARRPGIIAEQVWLLEQSGASTAFLVCGGQRQVPVRWLERYGDLGPGVRFYFLADDGQLEPLAGQRGPR